MGGSRRGLGEGAQRSRCVRDTRATVGVSGRRARMPGAIAGALESQAAGSGVWARPSRAREFGRLIR